MTKDMLTREAVAIEKFPFLHDQRSLVKIKLLPHSFCLDSLLDHNFFHRMEMENIPHFTVNKIEIHVPPAS